MNAPLKCGVGTPGEVDASPGHQPAPRTGTAVGPALACLLTLVSAAALADPIRLTPERCGPGIKEDRVVLLDLTGSPNPDALPEQIRQRVGLYEVVRTEEVVARTAFGRAWKKAQREAAAAGCDLVLIVDSGAKIVGAVGTYVPFPRSGGMVLSAPTRRDSASVVYGRRLTEEMRLDRLAAFIRDEVEPMLPIRKSDRVSITAVSVRREGSQLVLAYRYEIDLDLQSTLARHLAAELPTLRAIELEDPGCGGLGTTWDLDLVYRHEHFNANGVHVGSFEHRGDECT
jgi:hypothetical protein